MHHDSSLEYHNVYQFQEHPIEQPLLELIEQLYLHTILYLAKLAVNILDIALLQFALAKQIHLLLYR
jgi:hypothetical protein